MKHLEITGICVVHSPFATAAMVKLGAAADALLTQKPGTRAFTLPAGIRDAFTAIAASLAGEPVQLVRVLAFDKTPGANWGVPWHQDRTIAVKARAEVPGFGPWSLKAGVPHVQPPLALMKRMLVLRYHIDDCGPANGPLKIVPGSHKLGRVPASWASILAASATVVTCTVQAGDILAMKALTVHASEPADTPSHRRVLHMDFSPDGLPEPLQWAIDE